MKFKLLLLSLVFFVKCGRLKCADIFDDQPKILVHDGNLVFQSADSKNVSIQLKGKSRFLINDLDVLEKLTTNGSRSGGSDSSPDMVASLAAQIAKIRGMLKGQDGVLNRLDRVERGIPANATIPAGASDRSRFNSLTRRIATLETKVANLTLRLLQDHCKSYPCLNGGSCFNMFETFRCECPSNWEGPTCSLDVDECGKFAGTDLGCQNGATCVNLIGTYSCQCSESWKGQNCNRKVIDCLAVPQSEICGHGTCVQTKSKLGYTCICEQGWRLSNDTMSCTSDVDECREGRPHCSNDPKVICINTPGSFVCGPCPSGYTGNGYSCDDINECEINNGGCSVSPVVECINTRGSYRCSNCPFGYAGDGRFCVPDATRPNQQCTDSSICNENAQCIQYPNSPPMCICKPGYLGNGFGNNGCIASAQDSCSLRCRNGGSCKNNGTSTYCECPAGTRLPLCDLIVNPCSSNPCLNGGNCTSRFGRRYTCTCLKGFNGVNCQTQVKTCGGIRNAENGTISYPEGTDTTYRHNSRCAWLIKTNHTKVLNVTFTKFNIEMSRDCKFDWLQIHDGRSSSSHLIGRFCGIAKPKGGTIISTHNQLYLWFRSDNSTSHDGFELTWESIDPICGGDMNVTSHGSVSSPGSPGHYPMNRDCEWFITAPPGKRINFLFHTLMIEAHETCGFDFVEIHSGLGVESTSLGKYCNTTSPPPVLTPSNTATIHFHSDADSSDVGFQIAFTVVEGVPGCGGTYTNAKGDVVSPTNIDDGKYKHNMVCDYIIQVPKDSRVRIEFKKFALEESSGCKFDKVEIFEGSIYSEESLIGRYCGDTKPPVITSLTNTISVKFISDWSSNDEGFQFQYQLVCGGKFTAESGNISSPNYPMPYAGERHCEYDISAPQGKVIVLTIVDLDIEAHSTCDFDYLEIFDGFQETNTSSIGMFCGNTKPGIFTSSFNHLHIHFSSDASINGRGFAATYTFVDVECGGIIKDSSELIKSPMDTDDEGVYKSNAECRWLVFAPAGYVIQMNFISFDLEQDTTCKYDFVKIFNNGSGMGGEIGPFCGSNAPKVITTTENIATVLFKSDSSTAKEGFTIGLTFIEGTRLCGANYFSPQGLIRSPGRPEYLPNKECEWTVTVPQGQQIEITFNYFEVEQHATCRFDGLEIRNGGNSFAPLIGKFCGSTIPAPIRSFSNHLYFKFTSDASRGGQGFEIEWDGTSSGCGGHLTSTRGSISTPNYPTAYAHNSQCEWKISINEGSVIKIVFTDLDMELHAECKYDFIEVFDGFDASTKSFGKFCSSENHPTYLETTDNHALIRMQSDDSHSGRGFFLKYSTDCNRTIHKDSGVIESPNFPNDYPNNLDCSWTIVVSKGNKIKMQFSHFYLENDNQFHNETNHDICKYDFMELTEINFETKGEAGPKMTYCNNAPNERITTTDSVRIGLHTDASASGTGFRMEWFVEGCGGKLTHPEGSLTSPNYPKRYGHELTCKWDIEVEYGYKIELTIHKLEIEQSSSCEYDSLLITSDSSRNNTLLKICQSQPSPTVVTSDGHKLFVKFDSDESNNGIGFNMTYRTILSNCGGKFFSSQGIISSPSYPTTNYENNQNCEWNIKTDPLHTLTFQLVDFDLEQSENCSKDRVEIFDPVVQKLLWSGCGNQMPNQTIFKSQRNELNVRLITDDLINAKGFKGNFSNSCGARIVANDSGEFKYRRINDNIECVWTIMAEDPTKKVTITFTYVNIFLDTIDGCLSRIEVFDGDSDQGPLKTSFCGSKTPPAIVSNGNAITVKLNSTSLGFLSEFDIHYSVLDSACGGTYKSSLQGDFGSPNYPSSSPLSTYCIWNIEASAGNKISLTFKSIDIATSDNCNDNYLEIRSEGRNGKLVGLYCGNKIPENLISSQKFWIKYQTDGSSTNNGFLAGYSYIDHSELNGALGIIESPIYPEYLTRSAHLTYRLSVKQSAVVRLEFLSFYMDEEDEDECYTYVKIYNGYDETAPILQDEMCGDSPEPLTSDTNIIFIEFLNNHLTRSKYQIKWQEVDKLKNTSGLIDSECGDKVISLNNETSITNITSPGFPHGYGSGLTCSWTIVSGIPSFHPIVVFKEIDLEDITDCLGDYVTVSADREDGSWKELKKLCSIDLTARTVTFDGTPNLKLNFKSDYGTNGTGFSAYTKLECGGRMTGSEGIIEYNTTSIFSLYRIYNSCKWNITVRRGKTIQFEFLQLDIDNSSSGCNSFVTIRNGIDESSPYLGNGQICGKGIPPKVPATSSNRAFVKFKVGIPMFNSFKLRYSEVQHSCGGQIRLSSSNRSAIISSPNYPNIPQPHIECTWTVLVPAGERVRVDFIERFDISFTPLCDKEYVELRDGSTSSSQLIGTFCREKPVTQKSKSNFMQLKFFTDVPEPKNGFKANISIDVCGGSIKANAGYLTSKNYPGLGAYPSKSQCDYRITGIPNHLFNITILEIDLPISNETECNKKLDHIVMYSVMPDFNSTGDEALIEIGTFCGDIAPNTSFLSDTSEVLIRFNTADKTKTLYKGFKLFYNASKISCGGDVSGDSGVITSPGYPSKTISKMFCEWKITVPKGRRVKIDFTDVDLLMSNNQYLQRIGVYNDFRYSNRLQFITSNSSPEALYSSDNRIMVTMWVRVPSTNRGFRLRFSSDSSTVCEGSLNQEAGGISPPYDLNLTSYTCDYTREVQPIAGMPMNQGTIAYSFKDISVGKRLTNCRYSSTVVNVKRASGQTDDEIFLARLCGNMTRALTVLSPFPDVLIEVRQNPFFGQVNFTMNYVSNKCGGILTNKGVNYIRNPPGDASNQKVLDCAWFVRYEVGFSIAISVNNLKMKLPCDQEYIQIYNGPTALSPMMGKFCGPDFSKVDLASQMESVFIEYHTDNFVENSKESTFEIKLDAASFGCGGILTRNNFAFKSPKYDQAYPPNTECIWEIRGDPGYHIGLSFNDRFFLEDSTNCVKDYIEVFDYVDDNWISLGRRCGRDTPKPFNSTAERMKVVFHSDETTGGDGFSAVWIQNCGGTFKADGTLKTLASPGYPKVYGPNLLCNFTFVASNKDAFINLNFTDFAVETTGTKCLYDNVTIFKHPDYIYSFPVTPEKVGTFCGIKNPGKFRHRGVSTIIFRSDRWVERKGFEVTYQLDDCGGEVTTPTMITSPRLAVSSTYMGALHCVWNITAPADKKIVIKFENFSMEHSDYCSFDYVEVFNGTEKADKFKLAKICGNLTGLIKPIVISNNNAVVHLKTDQTTNFLGMSAAIYFKPKCDQKIVLSMANPTYVLDRTNQYYNESMECVYHVVGDPLSVIKISFSEFHMSYCGPERNRSRCDCHYVELLDGNSPFSEVIGRYCGYDIPADDIVSTRSAVYMRFVIDSMNSSTGFKATISLIESPCGPNPFNNFTGNETIYVTSPGVSQYPANIRCLWVAEAPYGKIFDIQFTKFEIEDSPNCENDSLIIEDNTLSQYVPEGLGEEIIYRGSSQTSRNPSFYAGVAGPTAPHVYCGSTLPHQYISQTNKININFKSNSEKQFAGFNFTVKVLQSCSRNFTALQGRIVSGEDVDDCKTTIKVPENYTIALFFHRFYFYEADCSKSFLKIFDGDFESGVQLKSYCSYAMPDPVFSTKNQLSLFFHFAPDSNRYSRGNYDIFYIATDMGRGCGGEIYNYGGVFSSPLYPSSNRTFNDCTWTVKVPQNLKLALKFSTFDMGSKLMCESDYIELLEENQVESLVSIKKYCGEDEPAVYISTKSKIVVRYVQTLNFDGTGWVINFMGVNEGADVQNW